MTRRIILASTSHHRKKLLSQTGLKFEVAASDYEEDMTLPLPPDELVKFLSRGKVQSVVSKYEDAIIIGADTIIYFEGKIFGKPHTEKRAFEMLCKLNGHTHSAFTGFTIFDTKNKKNISQAIETKLTFKNLSEKTIKDYIKNGNPLKYAGSYTLIDIKDKFVEKIEGDPSNVIGLPVNTLIESLKDFGVRV